LLTEIGARSVASSFRPTTPRTASRKNRIVVRAIKKQLTISGTEKKYDRGRSIGRATVVERASIAMIGESSPVKM
jgi:hypothetical protein